MKRKGHLFEELISYKNLEKAIMEVNKTHHWKARHKPNKTTAWVETTKEDRIKDLRRIILKGYTRLKNGKNIAVRMAESILSRIGQLEHCNNVHLYAMLFKGQRVAAILKRVARKHRKELMSWTMFLEQREAERRLRQEATATAT